MKKIIAIAVVVAAAVGLWFVSRPSGPKLVALDQPSGQAAIPWIKPDPNAFAAPEPNQVAFDLTYRGLSDVKDELFSRGFWGFGSGPPQEDPPFIKALKDKGIGSLQWVYNPNLKGAEWSAVQLWRGKPAAFYLDLDADGKVTANERLLPVFSEWPGYVDFVTPDFCLTTGDGVQVPFRLLMRVQGRGSDVSCMWAPACVLEGQATIDGQPAKVALCSYGPTGQFDQFGRSLCYLRVGQRNVTTTFQSLSSLVMHSDQFYRMRVCSDPGRKAVRVVLAKDRSPTGKLVLAAACDNDRGAVVKPVRIEGRDGNIYLWLQKDEQELPVGQYRIANGNIGYAVGESAWQCDFQRGPDFDIVASQECKIRVGQPKVTVKAIPEDKRYDNGVKPQSVYSRGDRIYITREVQGLAGEAYGRFSKKNDKNGYEDVKPQIRIADANGVEVVAKSMEYG
jgi:hypothetical protein